MAAAGERLAGLPAQVVQSDFAEIPRVLDRLGIGQVDGILLDLGVSSHQLDTPERGFSYMADAPLDMRMSQQGASAYDLVNSWDVSAMARVLREFGEEKYALPIAKKICRAREEKPVETTGELVELIKAAIPPSARYEGGHPAKRSFQAIRIAVNSELDSLSRCLDTAFARLAPGGRFAVITFHSLEDRMVKQKFAAYCKGCICPPDFPVCVYSRVCLRLRPCPGGEACQQKAHRAQPGGAAGEQPEPLRQAACFGEAVTKGPLKRP